MKLRKFRNRKGRCYELAFKTQADNPEWILIHGYAGGVLHAWLERDNEVYCSVLDRRQQKSEYESAYGTVIHAKYSREEAACLLIKTRHFGPW